MRLRSAALPVLALQVERDRSLVAIPDQERRAFAADKRGHRARIVAPVGPLDLDDIGTVVAEQHRAIRSGQMARKVHDSNSIQRSGHGTRAI